MRLAIVFGFNAFMLVSELLSLKPIAFETCASMNSFRDTSFSHP